MTLGRRWVMKNSDLSKLTLVIAHVFMSQKINLSAPAVLGCWSDKIWTWSEHYFSPNTHQELRCRTGRNGKQGWMGESARQTYLLWLKLCRAWFGIKTAWAALCVLWCKRQTLFMDSWIKLTCGCLSTTDLENIIAVSVSHADSCYEWVMTLRRRGCGERKALSNLALSPGALAPQATWPIPQAAT